MNRTRKLLAIRDKSTNSHKRSVEQGGKCRTSCDGFLSMYRIDSSKQTAKEEREREKHTVKVDNISNRLSALNLVHITADDVREALSSDYGDGDEEKALDYIILQNESRRGIIKPYDPSVHMVGAVNRGGVTCYLDALIFAMFARLDAFDGMLRTDFQDHPKRTKLAAVLRLCVNMLRTGKLIHTDLMKLLQDSIADCGWPEAGNLVQHDTSEAFAFITETLQLPLLPLQMDLFHDGIQNTEDHKVVYERLLILAIPEDPDEKGVTLEDCLEEYFNAKVDVTRDIQEKAGPLNLESDARSVLGGKSTIRLVTETGNPEAIREGSEYPPPISPAEKAPPALERVLTLSTINSSATSHMQPLQMLPSRPAVPSRNRSTSVIQNIVLDEQGRPSRAASEAPNSPQGPIPTGSSVAKASMIPAWQFWRLIRPAAFPRSATEPSSDAEMATSLDERPVVGICLRQYFMAGAGQARRHNTYVDIPDSLRLPYFMTSDLLKDSNNANALTTEYKLVLQSVVCHRGESTLSGHYVAFARVAPKLLTDNRRHSYDPPPDYEEAQWVRHDDLQTDSRVEYVEDIREALKDEMPYLLFYRIEPAEDMSSPNQAGETQPPSYEYSNGATAAYPPMSAVAERVSFADGLDRLAQTQTSPSMGDYFPTMDAAAHQPSNPPTFRVSSEIERPSAPTSDVGAIDSRGPSRRGSVTLAESNGAPSTTGTHSPAVTPIEETTAQRLSRAAVRLARTSRSRPSSQAGDGRVSMTARLLMRASKDPVLSEGASSNPVGAADNNTLGTTTESSAEGDVEGRQQATFQGLKRPRLKDKSRIKAALPERQCSVM